MDRRTRNLLALLVVAVIAVTGGAALVLGDPRPIADTNSPAGTTVVIGVIVGVDSQGLGDVRGFTLREAGNDVLLEFDLRDLESGTDFPPGHLPEHQVTAEPIRVWYRTDGSTLLAIRLEDAGP